MLGFDFAVGLLFELRFFQRDDLRFGQDTAFLSDLCF
jgi:hypothetical protein